MIKILKKLIPDFIKKRIEWHRKKNKNFKILSLEYAQLKTIKENKILNKDGNPLPWFTYPAIEYLSHLNLSEFSVFEYGSGYSTLFWLNKVKKIISVEHDIIWYEKIKHLLPQDSKIEYKLCNSKEDYINLLQKYKNNIIIIDGKWRKDCAIKVIEYINKYNNICDMVIFDNSDWYPNTINFLRKNLNFIEVDFHGFGPINNYCWTTTIFFNPKITLSYKKILMPIGGIIQKEEEDE